MRSPSYNSPASVQDKFDANSTPLANLTPKQARMYFVERIEAAQNQALNDKLDVVKDAARDLVAYYTNALQSKNTVVKEWSNAYTSAKEEWDKMRAATAARAVAAATLPPSMPSTPTSVPPITGIKRLSSEPHGASTAKVPRNGMVRMATPSIFGACDHCFRSPFPASPPTYPPTYPPTHPRTPPSSYPYTDHRGDRPPSFRSPITSRR